MENEIEYGSKGSVPVLTQRDLFIVEEFQSGLDKELDMGRVITIDGPAASGKTTVSRELARRLGWSWVSTGAFYRGLGYVAHQLNYDIDDEAKLVELAVSKVWRVEMTDANTKVFLHDKDVTEFINHESVGNLASKVSHFPKVREALLTPQRECMNKVSGLVAEGRDCGTVVFPMAQVKVYLTANQENRAERRAKDLGMSVEETVKQQTQRDQQDSTRKTAPLSVPESALVVDTTHTTMEEVVSKIEDFSRKQLKI